MRRPTAACAGVRGAGVTEGMRQGLGTEAEVVPVRTGHWREALSEGCHGFCRHMGKSISRDRKPVFLIFIF